MDKLLIINASEIATPKGNSARCGNEMQNIDIIKDGAIYIENDIIMAVGTTSDIKKMVGADVRVIDASGKCIVPGFVDSHTHFVFGGYRESEFIDRLEGVPYIELLKKGGGIMSTVNATKNTSFKELCASGYKRLDKMLQQGVTTIEGKSGYGLDLDCELKQLEVMRELDKSHSIDIVATYLGAHAVPEAFKGRNSEYIDYMLNTVLPIVKERNLAEFCDVFCEDSVFSIEESRKLLKGAKDLGFKPKIHADEIVWLGGAELAGEVFAVSADHLLRISSTGIKALADSGVIATLLPCTAFCLNKPYAPARKIIEGGAGVALASDLNPGSCFCNSIPLIMALAVINMGMTIEEALTAITLNGAAAIGKADTIGSIEVGKKADIVMLEYPNYKFLVYNTASNLVDMVIKNGVICYESKGN